MFIKVVLNAKKKQLIKDIKLNIVFPNALGVTKEEIKEFKRRK